MSLFGSLMGDVEDESFFGSQMSHMQHMNNMMNSFLSDPFSMLGGGPLGMGGPHHGNSLMPFMPQMPPINRLFGGGNFMGGPMGVGTSFSRSTIVMSSGPNGQPQVISSSSSTKYGPNGVKETRNTLQDTRTGTKKMSIGHHIGERAHLIEREQNYYSGDAEERQEYINIEEEEAEEFDREFQTKASSGQMRSREAIAGRRSPLRLALPAPPAAAAPSAHAALAALAGARRASSRRTPRASASPLAAHAHHSSPSVRDVYGTPHPKRQRHKHANRHRHADN